MKNTIIAKTLLTIWPGLDEYERSLADRAYTHALCSFNTPLHAERVMQKIIDLNVKQHSVRNLRDALDKVINQMPTDLQTIVRSYYRPYEPADNVKQLAERAGMSERSFFRRLDAATNYVARKLPQIGINFFTWQYLLLNHPWIKECFTRALQPNRRRNHVHQTE